MKILGTPLQGIILIERQCFSDPRGFFYETFQQARYQTLGIPPFVQDNMSRSKQHVLRGLHYQLPQPQGKLVWVGKGSVLDVMVDIRLSSPTFGKHFSTILSENNHLQIYIPPGFAHGFYVLSDEADFYYKCTDFYSPQAERGIIWNDPALNLPWSTATPLISDKDKEYPPLNEIPHDALFA